SHRHRRARDPDRFREADSDTGPHQRTEYRAGQPLGNADAERDADTNTNHNPESGSNPGHAHARTDQRAGVSPYISLA
ncbi:MAG: hypothetical protein QOE18_1365, partial [Chloroflexota bacterium]|nr:hypothetical protein [Chloroflexota bacterium]